MNTNSTDPANIAPGREAWLVATRLAWVVETVLVLALVLPGLPIRFRTLLDASDPRRGASPDAPREQRSAP